MTSCDKCSSSAATFIRYSGAHLCGSHLVEWVERRVKAELRRNESLPSKGRVAVAVSGGKDSLAALQLLFELCEKREGLEVTAITIDEGISGYREESIPFVADHCERLGCEHVVVSFEEELGTTLDRIASMESDKAPCSYCGVFRRKLLNQGAKRMDAVVLATGHNLDDTAQTIMMNLCQGNWERLLRIGPHKRARPGLIPHMLPLRTIPEKESTLYAIFKKIPFHDRICPYAERAHRGRFRSVLAKLENDTPGTRHSLLRGFDEVEPILRGGYPQVDLGKCEKCGEPTGSKWCKACDLLASL